MCGRYHHKRQSIVKTIAGFQTRIDWEPRFNVSPTQIMPVIVWDEAQPVVRPMKWGLIPFFSKEPKMLFSAVNAKAETLNSKPMWKRLLQKKRCLIPADGFYEWERSGKISQPYYFRLKDGEPFAFAGIWDRWRANDRVINSCAIITTKANELLATIHTRMPVILPPELYDFWLNEDSREPELKDILMPFPAAEMTSHAVSYEVNDVRNEGEHLLRPVEPNIGVNLRLF